MKNIFLILLFTFMNGKLSAEQFFFISGLNITQVNENQIKANLIIDGGGSQVYNSYMVETAGTTITLKVCYDYYIFDGGTQPNNDFLIDIPSPTGNYTLKVEIYSSGSNGCNYLPPYLQDSATINFTTPFTGVISLGTADSTTKNDLKFYPNPVKEILNFSDEVSNIRISDLSGKTVKAFPAKSTSISVSEIPKGVYLFTATKKSGEVVSKKILKE